MTPSSRFLEREDVEKFSLPKKSVPPAWVQSAQMALAWM
jgi:hypothetical protein